MNIRRLLQGARYRQFAITALALAAHLTCTSVWAEPTPLLKYSPPVLENPITINVSNADRSIKFPTPGVDYIVKFTEKITDGLSIWCNNARNVVLIGGEIELNVGSGSRRALYLQAWAGTFHLEGVWMHGNNLAEGVNISAPAPGSRLQVQNVRLDNVRGTDAERADYRAPGTHHPDLFQNWSGPAYYLIDRMTGTTDYQGFMMQPLQFNTTRTTLAEFNNMNIYHSGTHGYQIYRAGGTDQFILNNVYFAANAAKGYPNTDPTWATASVGVPPGGDFVIGGAGGVGIAGPGYISPGYMSEYRGLRAEFFDYTTSITFIPNLDARSADIVRVDAQVNYPATTSAWTGLPSAYSDTFAARHTGSINIAQAGTYTIYLNSDDGSRLYIDGSLAISNEGIHGMREYSTTRTLTAGLHPIRLEYFDNTNAGGMILSWAGPGIAKQVIPASAFVLPTSFVYETETLPVQASSGDTHRILTETGFSLGKGSILDANAVGDYVTYRLPNVAEGSYNVRLGVKKSSSQGTVQVAIGSASYTPSNVGPVQDLYSSSPTYVELNLGSWSPVSTSDKHVQIKVTGKNASSTGFAATIDYIELIPQ